MEHGSLQAGLKDRKALTDGLLADAGTAQIDGEAVDECRSQLP
jgi:hypothetical protein